MKEKPKTKKKLLAKLFLLHNLKNKSDNMRVIERGTERIERATKKKKKHSQELFQHIISPFTDRT